MKVFCIQFNSKWMEKRSNFQTITSLLKHPKIPARSLIVLPEMFATGFCLDPSMTTMGEPERTESFLSKLSKEKESWVMAGMNLPSKCKDKAYNTAVTFNPEGKKISVYKKMHLISMLGENHVHLAGKQVTSISIGSFTASPAICYDLRFPKLFRDALQLGANLFVVLGCWPKVRIKHWITLLQARAIENQAYVIGVNRVGEDPSLRYGGHSMIVSPKGEIIKDALEKEGIIDTTIELQEVKKWRSEFPVIPKAKQEI